MEKYIPYEKLSKKARSEYDKRKRRGWGEKSPITKKSENKKLYNRKRTERFENSGFQSNGLFVCAERGIALLFLYLI
jgi:hypothetical protein